MTQIFRLVLVCKLCIPTHATRYYNYFLKIICLVWHWAHGLLGLLLTGSKYMLTRYAGLQATWFRSVASLTKLKLRSCLAWLSIYMHYIIHLFDNFFKYFDGGITWRVLLHSTSNLSLFRSFFFPKKKRKGNEHFLVTKHCWPLDLACEAHSFWNANYSYHTLLV